MNIHPDVLAAIGAAQIGHNVPPLLHCNRHNDSNKVTNGMCMYTSELLDSLASLSVAQANSQVVAIALQMGSSRCPAVLTIAENGPVKPSLLAHVKHLLTLLRSMAVEYRKLGIWNKPLTAIPSAVEGYRNSLIKSVYLYSVDKILRRFEIYWGRIESDLRLCGARVNAKKLGDAGEWFGNAVCSLQYVHTILKKIKVNKDRIRNDEWLDLIRGMDRTIGYLEDGNHSVAEIFYDRTTGALCIEALNKLCSHHHHIQNLTRIAHSARDDNNIRFDMTVRKINHFTNVPIDLPETVEELQRIIALIMPSKNQLRQKQARDIIQRFPQAINARGMPRSKAYGNVHCECALITHLQNLPRNGFGIPPCNYIGVSKLSCAPCDAWIHAFNTISGPDAVMSTYHTMGTHSKWYRSWAMPLGSPVCAEVARLMGEKLALGFMVSGGHGGSDSTIAKGNCFRLASDGTSLATDPDDLLSQDGTDSESSLNPLFYQDVR